MKGGVHFKNIYFRLIYKTRLQMTKFSGRTWWAHFPIHLHGNIALFGFLYNLDIKGTCLLIRLWKIYHSFCSKASRAVSRMLTGLNGKSISFCTDKQGPICYQLSICVVDPQMTYFVFQTQINQANRHKVDHSRRGKRAIATR